MPVIYIMRDRISRAKYQSRRRREGFRFFRYLYREVLKPFHWSFCGPDFFLIVVKLVQNKMKVKVKLSHRPYPTFTKLSHSFENPQTMIYDRNLIEGNKHTTLLAAKVFESRF